MNEKGYFFYLLRRGLLGAGGFVRDGLVMAASKLIIGITHPAQGSAEFDGSSDYILTNDLGSEYLGSFSCWFLYNNRSDNIDARRRNH